MAKKISKNQKKSKKENKGKKKKENQNKNKKKIINFVSSNKNKLRELNEMFNEHFKDVEVKLLDIDLPELQGLPEDIVKGKLKIALEKSKNLKGPILVEDTSLCFNAYGGLSGPYIKYFLKAIKQEGEIVYPRGQKNFGLLGWDPCFKPNCSNKTYAEMEEDEKNKISHRGKSTKALIEYLKKNEDIFQ